MLAAHKLGAATCITGHVRLRFFPSKTRSEAKCDKRQDRLAHASQTSWHGTFSPGSRGIRLWSSTRRSRRINQGQGLILVECNGTEPGQQCRVSHGQNWYAVPFSQISRRPDKFHVAPVIKRGTTRFACNFDGSYAGRKFAVRGELRCE